MERIALLIIALIFFTACATTKSVTPPQTARQAEQQQPETTWKQKADNVSDSIGRGIKKGFEWLVVDDLKDNPSNILDWIWSFMEGAASVWRSSSTFYMPFS